MNIINNKKCLELSDIETKYNEKPLRSTRLRKTPVWHEDYNFSILALNANTFIEDLPNDHNSIIAQHDEKPWFEAIEEELQSLNKNRTLEIMKLPDGRKPVDSK